MEQEDEQLQAGRERGDKAPADMQLFVLKPRAREPADEEQELPAMEPADEEQAVNVVQAVANELPDKELPAREPADEQELTVGEPADKELELTVRGQDVTVVQTVNVVDDRVFTGLWKHLQWQENSELTSDPNKLAAEDLAANELLPAHWEEIIVNATARLAKSKAAIEQAAKAEAAAAVAAVAAAEQELKDIKEKGDAEKKAIKEKAAADEKASIEKTESEVAQTNRKRDRATAEQDASEVVTAPPHPIEIECASPDNKELMALKAERDEKVIRKKAKNKAAKKRKSDAAATAVAAARMQLCSTAMHQ
jgi:hypothetical protein